MEKCSYDMINNEEYHKLLYASISGKNFIQVTATRLEPTTT